MGVRLLVLVLGIFGSAHAEVYLTEGTNISVDVTQDGRTAIDLLGGIWVVPSGGGDAKALQEGFRPAQRPRWSPAADALVYQAKTGTRDQLWFHDFDSDSAERLGNGRYFDQHPDWHPNGERIVFSSDRFDSGFDLWEIDLPTKLAWRLSSLPGDETEPTWSDDGRNLVYVHEFGGRWSLMLRRFGQADETLTTSEMRLAAPSWRPDNSLLTYMKLGADGWSIRMIILSDPVLDRPLIDGEDFFVAPVSWLDRQQMLYTANGHIRTRPFNSRSSNNIPFRAAIGETGEIGLAATAVRDLPAIEEPTGKTVIRAARMFDGTGNAYRSDVDIVIEGGRITAVENHEDRADAIVIDLGDITVLPGYIDAYATLPEDADASLGPLLLGLGVTTLVAEHQQVEALNVLWSGKEIPGPRLLAASSLADAGKSTQLPWLVTVTGDMSAGVAQRDAVRSLQSQGITVLADSWQVGLGSGASLLIGAQTMPTSPAGRSYQDVQLASGAGPITLVSGLADISTPGIDAVQKTRQAMLISRPVTLTRRFAQPPDLSAAATTIVLASRPNEMPPGIGLHAEFQALIKAGLSTEQTLKAAGVNAAGALGLGPRLGRIAAGAAADMVLVDGNPLNDIADALKIVAVVRNGRFFSVSGLIDRAAQAKRAQNVE